MDIGRFKSIAFDQYHQETALKVKKGNLHHLETDHYIIFKCTLSEVLLTPTYFVGTDFQLE